MTERKNLRACPCGRPAFWYRKASDPATASESAVCFLTDADFADDLCDACFEQTCRDNAFTPLDKSSWERISAVSSPD